MGTSIYEPSILVGFNPAFMDAVLDTLNLGPIPGESGVVNPTYPPGDIRRYGASVAAAPAVNTIALQTAIDNAARVGGTVIIDGDGNYQVAATTHDVPGATGKYVALVQGDDLSIVWRGSAKLECVTDAATVLAVAGSGGTAAEHVKNVTLWNPQIVGGDTTNNGLGRGLFFYRADRCTVVGGDISGCRLGVQFDRATIDADYNVGNRVLGTLVHDTFGTTTGNGTGFFVSGCDQLELSAIQAIDVAEHGLYINQNTRNVTVTGNFKPAVNTNQNCGVQIFADVAAPDIDGITLLGVHVANAKWGILASPGGAGGRITRVNVFGGTATACLTNGLVFSNVDDCIVDGFQVSGTTNGNGLEADVSKRVQFRGCTSQLNGLNGLLLDASTDCQIDGGAFMNNDQLAGVNSGVRLANASTDAKLSNFLASDDQGVKTQDYGITIDAAATNATIDNVTLSGNAAGPFQTFGAAGTQITACPGYNPVGPSAISVDVSPFTYTAGTSPETVYIFGGTVSDVSKSGVQIAAATDISVELGPNESITVTYSSGPSMTKDVH